MSLTNVEGRQFMKFGFCFLLLFLIPMVQAEDINLRTGRVFKDAVVVSSGEDFVNIQHADGVARVSYKDLTDDQQKMYRMTPKDVQGRMETRRKEDEARKKKAEESKKIAEEEARKLRESLSESERIPRYLEGADISRIFLMMGELSQVEAEVMALLWNVREANRVGLSEDARIFREKAATYQELVNDIRKKRKADEQYWLNLEKEYQTLKTGTQKKIADLNKQVAQLQGEVKEVASQPRTERIILPSVIRPWNYSPPPVIIRPTPPPPPRLRPCPPVRPVRPIVKPGVIIG